MDAVKPKATCPSETAAPHRLLPGIQHVFASSSPVSRASIVRTDVPGSIPSHRRCCPARSKRIRMNVDEAGIVGITRASMAGVRYPRCRYSWMTLIELALSLNGSFLRDRTTWELREMLAPVQLALS